MPDYKQGKIYKIVNDVNDIVYIGSTCGQLSKRMGGHRYDAINRSSALYVAMRTIGNEHFKIVLMRNYPCKSQTELLAKEFNVTQKLLIAGKPLYNSMINGKHSATSKTKQSKWHTGRTKSKSHRKNLSDSKRKRGSVCYMKSTNAWAFAWYPEPSKQKMKTFSVRKYGDKNAKKMATAAQNAMYPE